MIKMYSLLNNYFKKDVQKSLKTNTNKNEKKFKNQIAKI